MLNQSQEASSQKDVGQFIWLHDREKNVQVNKYFFTRHYVPVNVTCTGIIIRNSALFMQLVSRLSLAVGKFL